jgi:hypothetical protein
MADQILRVSGTSAANTAQTLSITSGNTKESDALFGRQIQPLRFMVHYDSTVNNVDVSITLNSGLGANFDTKIKKDTVSTAENWIWNVTDEVSDWIILPYQSSTILADALDFLVDAGGGSTISYATIYYKVLP